MSLASRNFNKKQALEHGVVDIYGKFTITSFTAPTITLATTSAIVLTKSLTGSSSNGGTFTVVVNAAAANPTDTILATFSGTSAARVVTITPNDGTNNTATPVNLTSANLVELINTGLVSGKTITLTDSSSLRVLQTATGGNTTNLAHGGNGDGATGTWAGGAEVLTNNSKAGVSSLTRNSAGDYTLTLSDRYVSLKSFKGVRLNTTAKDLLMQAYAEDVAGAKTIRFLFLTGTVATDPAAGTVVFFKAELKNSSTTV